VTDGPSSSGPLDKRRDRVLSACEQVLRGQPARLIKAAVRDRDVVLEHAVARLCALELLATLAILRLRDDALLRLVGSALAAAPSLASASTRLDTVCEQSAAHVLAQHLGITGLPNVPSHASSLAPARDRSLAMVLNDAERAWPLGMSHCCSRRKVQSGPDALAVAQAVTAAILEGRWLTAARVTWWLAAARAAWCRQFAVGIATRATVMSEGHSEVAFHAAALLRLLKPSRVGGA
jgi:hypothetical protein